MLFNKNMFFKLLGATIFAFTTILPTPTTFAEDTVTVKINDSAFYSALGTQVGCASFNNEQQEITITKTCQESKTFIDISMNPEISDISGIDTLLPYLTYIAAYDSNINDISPLANLEYLTRALFESNAISDISPIEDKLSSLNISFYNQTLSYTIGKNKMTTPQIFDFYTRDMASIESCDIDDSVRCLKELENATFSDNFRTINITDINQPARVVLYGHPYNGNDWKTYLVTINITVDPTIDDDADDDEPAPTSADEQPIENSPATIDKSSLYLLALIAALICAAITVKKSAQR